MADIKQIISGELFYGNHKWTLVTPKGVVASFGRDTFGMEFHGHQVTITVEANQQAHAAGIEEAK